jgi:Cof subfamily protein (haloacid dehalogenase superfamily)
MREETIAAVRDLMKAGYSFYICTGRSRESMAAAVGPDFLSLFGSDVSAIPGVYQQGLQVYGQKGALIHERLLDEGLIEKVEKFCAERETSVIAYCGSTIYTSSQSYHTRKIVEYKEPIPTLCQTVGSETLSSLPNGGHAVHKLILLAEDEQLDALRPALEEEVRGLASITKAVKGMLEVLPFGANKGEGVEVLLKHLNADPKRVVSFGDGENDVEMLKLVGLGVAVNNAKPLLKDAAALVLEESNDEQAVARCLRDLVAWDAESGSCSSLP